MSHRTELANFGPNPIRAFPLDPPRSRYPVDCAVDIPVDAEPGTHYGTILAVAQAGDGGGGAQIVTKVGAVLLADVYGDVREALRVAGFSVPQFSSKLPIALAARFENTDTVRGAAQGRDHNPEPVWRDGHDTCV